MDEMLKSGNKNKSNQNAHHFSNYATSNFLLCSYYAPLQISKITLTTFTTIRISLPMTKLNPGMATVDM